MKGLEKKVNPYSEIHYGEQSTGENKDRARQRVKKYLDREWHDTWFSAARRVLQEMMPREKFEAYARVAGIVAYENGIELSQDNVQISTNRHGRHSWYITFPNPERNENTDEEDSGYYDEHDHSDEGSFSVKITDHLTNRLQRYTKDEAFIVTTYCVDDEDPSKVRVLYTDVNDQLGADDADSGRVYDEMTIDELEASVEGKTRDSNGSSEEN